jgi:hypothetical protein
MSTDICAARKELKTAIFLLDNRGNPNDVRRRVKTALDQMTRTVNKKAVKLGNKMTSAIRSQIILILESGEELADVEISERIFGNAGGSGRVSEIRSELAK